MSIPTRKAEPMTGSVTRIRWQDTPVGTISGHVGTVEQEVFAIWKPPQASGEWVLESEIPGLSAARCYSDDPGTLKAEAERWLERFVSSLAAVFPKGENCGCPPADPPYCGFCGKPRHVEQAAVKAGED